MTVYFIQAGSKRSPVKIGHSNDVQARLGLLDLYHHSECQLIREIPGARRTERWLHQYFARKHMRREWFRFDPEMLTIQPPAIEELPPRLRCPAMLKAIRLAGYPHHFAKKLGISTQAVSAWNRVPEEHVLKMERLTRGRVTRYEMRPDIYGASL